MEKASKLGFLFYPAVWQQIISVQTVVALPVRVLTCNNAINFSLFTYVLATVPIYIDNRLDNFNDPAVRSKIKIGSQIYKNDILFVSGD